jgi:hypothetical protein
VYTYASSTAGLPHCTTQGRLSELYSLITDV